MALEAWVILRAAGASITPTRRAGGRDVLARRELRAPRSSRRTSARSKHRAWPPRGRRRGRRRRRARACPAAPRPVLGRSRPRDLPAAARDESAPDTRRCPPRPCGRPANDAPVSARTTRRSPVPPSATACRTAAGRTRSPPRPPRRLRRGSSSGSRTTRMGHRPVRLHRLMRNIGGEIADRDEPMTEWPQRSRELAPDRRRDGDRRRHHRVDRAAQRCTRRPGRSATLRATCPPAPSGRVSGVLRLTAAAAADPRGAARDARRTPGTGGAPPIRQGRVATARARLALRIVDPADLARRRAHDPAQPATRIPTRKSRASTGASRCRSASR